MTFDNGEQEPALPISRVASLFSDDKMVGRINVDDKIKVDFFFEFSTNSLLVLRLSVFLRCHFLQDTGCQRFICLSDVKTKSKKTSKRRRNDVETASSSKFGRTL